MNRRRDTARPAGTQQPMQIIGAGRPLHINPNQLQEHHVTVLQFPADRLDAKGLHTVQSPAGGCPSWCARPADEADHFHSGEPFLYVEHDDEQDPVFAVRVSVEQILPVCPVVVSFKVWQAGEIGYSETESVLTVAEARTIAHNILKAADIAEAAR